MRNKSDLDASSSWPRPREGCAINSSASWAGSFDELCDQDRPGDFEMGSYSSCIPSPSTLDVLQGPSRNSSISIIGHPPHRDVHHEYDRAGTKNVHCCGGYLQEKCAFSFAPPVQISKVILYMHFFFGGVEKCYCQVEGGQPRLNTF